jgi:hypothetical protein
VKFLDPVIQNEQRKLDKVDSREIKEVEYKDNTLEKPRKPFGKKGKLSRLKDLENE